MVGVRPIGEETTVRKNEKQTKKSNHNRRGIDYRPARAAMRNVADWLIDLAADDVRGWREGERRLRDVRRYVHARIDGEDSRAPSEEALVFTATQLVRAFASDPRVAAIAGELVGDLDALLPMVGAIARSSRGGAPPCAMPAIAVPPMPVRPPGVPLSVPIPNGVPASRACLHLRVV